MVCSPRAFILLVRAVRSSPLVSRGGPLRVTIVTMPPRLSWSTLGLLSVGLTAAAPPTELVFNFTTLRGSWRTLTQLSEITLRDSSSSPIAGYNAANPLGSSPTNQEAGKAFDGTTAFKWSDVNFGSNGYSTLHVLPAVEAASCALEGGKNVLALQAERNLP